MESQLIFALQEEIFDNDNGLLGDFEVVQDFIEMLGENGESILAKE